jgi:hypothetical protein
VGAGKALLRGLVAWIVCLWHLYHGERGIIPRVHTEISHTKNQNTIRIKLEAKRIPNLSESQAQTEPKP